MNGLLYKLITYTQHLEIREKNSTEILDFQKQTYVRFVSNYKMQKEDRENET